MSAFADPADSSRTSRDVREVPCRHRKADYLASFVSNRSAATAGRDGCRDLQKVQALNIPMSTNDACGEGSLKPSWVSHSKYCFTTVDHGTLRQFCALCDQPIDLQNCKVPKRVLGHNAKDVVRGIIADALGYP